MNERPPASQTLDRGITVVEAIAMADGGATVAELARYTGFDRAVVHRLVSTLLDRGWVVVKPPGNRFHPGPALAELGNRGPHPRPDPRGQDAGWP